MLKGKYQWAIVCVLFLAACGVKWYYLAQQYYYVVFSDELVGAYNLSESYGIKTLLHQIFLECNYTLGHARPFFTMLLYILTFKLFGYQPQVWWTMGIIVGSLLAPLYFLLISAMINVEVALASSLILLWMSNYIWQSMALTAIIPGILFIVGALLAAVRFYQRGGLGYLYLSGCLISMSVFCRYENAILVPAFVGYQCLFDKERKTFSNIIVYGLLCASSSFYILFCNYTCFNGDPFHMIRMQSAATVHLVHSVPVRMTEAFEIVGQLLLRLLTPWLWGAAAAGMVVMIMRYRLRALWLFLGMLPLELLLIYKIKTASLDFSEGYFFLLALIALPVGLECVRALFVRLGHRRSYGMIALGVVALCSIVSFQRFNAMHSDGRLNYTHELIRLFEALKCIPATSALYIDDDLTLPGYSPQMMLAYLSRNPEKYRYYSGKADPQRYPCTPGKTEPPEMEYYFLTAEDKTGEAPKREGIKVRDYRA
ncbi:MAG: glycosyltransferase family 39 protein, partial [Candidatus Omnitrophota bacterium]